MVKIDNPDVVTYVDGNDLTVEGRGFPDLGKTFRRLPARLEAAVPKMVWLKSSTSAGHQIRFQTDATSISIKWTIGTEVYQMHHMASTGCSGIDLYVMDEFGKWSFVMSKGSYMNRAPATEMEVEFVNSLTQQNRQYHINLPLYNDLVSVAVGVKGATHLSPLPREGDKKPIVFYGTSITQGACASRPGQAYPSVVGRRLNYPIVNLGFSGNGKAEIELADVVGEVEASVYVIDCVANIASADDITARYEPFVNRLRSIRPDTPIVLMESGGFARTCVPCVNPADQFCQQQAVQKNANVRAAYKRLRGTVPRLYLVKGDDMYGDDGESTVDGLHPNDVGMFRMADQVTPVIKKVLSENW